jgi:hypothetical protein
MTGRQLRQQLRILFRPRRFESKSGKCIASWFLARFKTDSRGARRRHQRVFAVSIAGQKPIDGILFTSGALSLHLPPRSGGKNPESAHQP